MRIFDWEQFKADAQPKRFKWLRENHNKHITEDEFISAMQTIKDTQRGRVKNQNYKISRLKRQYNHLTTRFGFFAS